MAEAPRPRLALVDRAMEGVEPLASKETDRKIVSRYAGNIAKLARADERAAIFQAIGAKSVDEFSHLARLTAERDARPTPEAHAYAKKAARNMGALMGMAAGATLTVLVGSALIAIGSRSTVEGAAVGSMIRAQSDNTQTLEDIETGEHGRVPLPETP